MNKIKYEEIIYKSKYSRWDDKLKRRENWDETIDRYKNFMLNNVLEKRLGKDISENILNDFNMAIDFIKEKNVVPSMRALWSSGKALEQSHIASYNCAYIVVDSFKSFAETMYILMHGTGVGFSVESQYVNKMPSINSEMNETDDVIEFKDSRLGWAKGYYHYIQHLVDGQIPKYDVSRIRPAGTKLKTFGGFASGSQVLVDLLEYTKKKFITAKGRKLTTLECHDIMCKVAEAVVSGGTRRSALISLSNLHDIDIRDCKSGEFWILNPERTNANNSAVYETKPSLTKFNEEFMSLIKSKTGERGIVNREALVKNKPERRNSSTFGVNPCVVGDTKVMVADERGYVDIKILAEIGDDVPVYCVDDKNNVVIRTMRNPRVTGYNEDIYEITLENDEKIRCTANHEFCLKDGTVKRADELEFNDALDIITKNNNVSKKSNTMYNTVLRNGKKLFEHRLLYRFYHNYELNSNEDIHHLDRNGLNNKKENLVCLDHQEHAKLHGKDDMLGKNNPIYKIKEKYTEEEWNEYLTKLSIASCGKNNPNYSGYSHEDIFKHALILTLSLGRRFSNREWVKYATEYGLPQNFSKYRINSIGNIQKLSHDTAKCMGFEFIDLDTRQQETINKLKKNGYEVIVKYERILVKRICEYCKNEFYIDYKHREQSFCSQQCSGKYLYKKYEKRIKTAISIGHEKKREALKKKQIELFKDLKMTLNREPKKGEWVEYVKSKNISSEICRKSSPFLSWRELKEYADMYNHRVKSVKYYGKDVVYNGTVDDYHNFFIGDFSGKSDTETQKNRITSVRTFQCGEVSLIPCEFCNLTEVAIRENDDLDVLLEKVKYATILGILQSCLTDFKFISSKWKKNCEEERLLGVSLTGLMDNPVLNSVSDKSKEYLTAMKKRSIEVAEEWSKYLDINMPASITTCKPSGTTSQVLNTSSGIHARFSKYYIRRVRFAKHDPICSLLIDAGVKWNPEVGQLKDNCTTVVFDFPIKSPESSKIVSEMDAIEQLEYWKMLKEYWAEHNVSATIYVKENEWFKVMDWVYSNWDIVAGLSFLPLSDNVYKLAPYEEISKEEYENMVKEFPEIDLALLTNYEQDDKTTGAKEFACVGGVCELI